MSQAYTDFATRLECAYEALEVARSITKIKHHEMVMFVSDATIAAYEEALDREAEARANIGSINDEELRARARDASIR